MPTFRIIEGGRDGDVTCEKLKDRSSPAKGRSLTEEALDELGPVDYLILESPAKAANFTGEMAQELLTGPPTSPRRRDTTPARSPHRLVNGTCWS